MLYILDGHALAYRHYCGQVQNRLATASGETAEDVAERIRTALKYVAADKLSVTPDCGFSQTARWATKAKLKAMVEGAKIVRRELMGG